MVGIITGRTIKQTKNKENMAFITLEDETGTIELVVFPKNFEKYADALVVENVISAFGQVSVREDEPHKILLANAENLILNSDYQEKATNPKLYLKVDDINSKTVSQISEILKEGKGNCEVIFFDSSTKKYVKNKELSINITDEVIEILKMILGSDNVVLKQ